MWECVCEGEKFDMHICIIPSFGWIVSKIKSNWIKIKLNQIEQTAVVVHKFAFHSFHFISIQFSFFVCVFWQPNQVHKYLIKFISLSASRILVINANSSMTAMSSEMQKKKQEKKRQKIIWILRTLFYCCWGVVAIITFPWSDNAIMLRYYCNIPFLLILARLHIFALPFWMESFD